MDGYFQPGAPGLHDRRDEFAEREIPLAVGQVDAEDVPGMAYRPIHGLHAGVRAEAAGSDGDQADGHSKLALGASLGLHQGLQGRVPVQVMAGKSPIRREADLEELDVLAGRILEEFPGNALHDRGSREAIAGYTKG